MATATDNASGSRPLALEDGSCVAVIGCGPAGSLFSHFLLEMAARVDVALSVDLYEPRNFAQPGPAGCNMCGGIVSEALVQNLGMEGVHLPPGVVQRGIDSYVLHTDVGTVRIATPTREMRIGALHRGAGPRDVSEKRWESFDGHLQAKDYVAAARTLAPVVTQQPLTEPEKRAVGVALEQINQGIAADRSLNTKEMYELRARMFQAVHRSGSRF